MQIQTIKNRNFGKPLRNLLEQDQNKLFELNFFWISLQKNLVPRMLSHREHVRTSKFWRKSKEKKQKFFENLPRAYKDLIQVKKNYTLFHDCVPLTFFKWFCHLIFQQLKRRVGLYVNNNTASTTPRNILWRRIDKQPQKSSRFENKQLFRIFVRFFMTTSQCHVPLALLTNLM